MLKTPTQNNVKIYVKYLPLIGLLSSIILLVYFFCIERVNYDIGWGILYCMMPFLIYSVTSLIIKKKKT